MIIIRLKKEVLSLNTDERTDLKGEIRSKCFSGYMKEDSL